MEPTPRQQLPYTDDDVTHATQRLREICMRLPEITERLSHGAVTFFVRGKRTVAYLTDDHHGDGRLALVCAAPPGVQAELVANEPDRFFRPPYVGHRGWIGLRLDVEPDWDEVAAVSGSPTAASHPRRSCGNSTTVTGSPRCSAAVVRGAATGMMVLQRPAGEPGW